APTLCVGAYLDRSAVIGGRGASGRCSHAERGNNKGMMPRRGLFFRARSRKKAFSTNFGTTCWSLKTVPGSSFLVTSCSQAGAWEQEKKRKRKEKEKKRKEKNLCLHVYGDRQPGTYFFIEQATD
ncbi:hypothetical protein, partial [Desulfonatronospira sp.]|uniref:hypothetical protein n=1 Tax=Desulfonatronospira sp. TaxID=1962951 RepID=UPI0025B9AEC0